MDETVEALIDRLDLQSHPEGGYYRRTYESDRRIDVEDNGGSSPVERRAGSAILYLLPATEVSRFHRLKSDEIWHYHWGNSLTLHVLERDGYRTEILGPNLENGEQPQVTVEGGRWFGATVGSGYTLVSCTVVPEFDYEDYELASEEQLKRQFPEHGDVIEELT